MAIKDKSVLKTYFETGDTPTQSNFVDLIDSTYNNLSEEQALDLTDGAETQLHKHASNDISVDSTALIVISSSNVQGSIEQIDSAVLNTTSTGVRLGGDVTINALDSNTFDVSAMEGNIVDNTDPENELYYSVAYSSKTGVVPQNEGLNHLYYLPNDDTLYQTLIPPTYETRKSRIYIGRVVYRDFIIRAVSQDRDYIQQSLLQLRSLAEAIGQIRLSGLKHSANGANLRFNIEAGVLFDFGSNGIENPHQISFTARTPATFQYWTQTEVITVDRQDLDPTQYDVGGVLTAVSNNKFTIQDIYIFGSGNVRVQYGQAEYNSLSEAVSAINSRSYVEFETAVNGLRIGWIVLKKEATSLLSATDAKIVLANKFGE